jgi:hypothetical protein
MKNFVDKAIFYLVMGGVLVYVGVYHLYVSIFRRKVKKVY